MQTPGENLQENLTTHEIPLDWIHVQNRVLRTDRPSKWEEAATLSFGHRDSYLFRRPTSLLVGEIVSIVYTLKRSGAVPPTIQQKDDDDDYVCCESSAGADAASVAAAQALIRRWIFALVEYVIVGALQFVHLYSFETVQNSRN